MKLLVLPRARFLTAGAMVAATALLTQLAPLATSAAPVAAAATAPASHGALITSDEFSGAAGSAPSASTWTALTGGGGWGNNELESYTARSSNVSQNGAGDLAITARKENYTGADGKASTYTSARLISKQAVQYGYLEARIYLPAGQGLWPAFWTVGADIYQGVAWPKTGEIDIMEATNAMDHNEGTIHGDTTSGGQYAITKAAPATPLAGSWHTYAINWTATAITFLQDGVAYNTIQKSSLTPAQKWEFSKPQLIQLNLAVGGNGPGAPNASTPAVSTMLVDYVRYYAN